MPEMTIQQPIEDEYAEAERDARGRLVELEARRRSLLVDAEDSSDEVTTVALLSELDGVEREIRVCQTTLERIGLLRVEHARRDASALAADQAAGRAQALEEARELGVQRRRAAQDVDVALREVARRIVVHRELVARQGVRMEAAGRRGFDPSHHRMVSRSLEHAMARALGDEGAHAAIELPPLQPREIKCFVEGDPAPRFEPAGAA